MGLKRRIKDLIARMGGVDAIRVGIETEFRFFRIMREVEHPPWFKGCRGTSWRYDLFGVDAVVWITKLGSRRRIKIPIQIKSSEKGKMFFFAHWLSHWFSNVIVVVINESMTDEHILAYVYNRLLHIRMAGYDYTEFFAEISANKIPVRTEKRMKAFAEVRDMVRNEVLG